MFSFNALGAFLGTSISGFQDAVSEGIQWLDFPKKLPLSCPKAFCEMTRKFSILKVLIIFASINLLSGCAALEVGVGILDLVVSENMVAAQNMPNELRKINSNKVNPATSLRMGSSTDFSQNQSAANQNKNNLAVMSYSPATECLYFDTESNQLASFAVNSCAKTINIRWQDEGYCAKGKGCGDTLRPYSKSSITKLKGRYNYQACEYPGNPFLTEGNAFVCK